MIALIVFLSGVLIGGNAAYILVEQAIFLYEQYKRKEQNG